LIPFTIALTGALSPSTAQAQRVFVGATGTDSNPCTFTQPCRTFQHAHDTVAAGGEIDVLDPAGYGIVNINKAISIQGHGFAGIAAPSGNAVVISAGASDKINLRGLLIDGVGTGANGILFNSGGSLNIQDSLIRNFTGAGISVAPSAAAAVFVSDTVLADNGDGVVIAPSGSAVVNAMLARINADNNINHGVFANGQAAGTTINVTLFHSVAASSSVGVQATSAGGSTNVMVRDTAVAGNQTGLTATGNANAFLRVAHSVITANNTGWSVANSASVLSYADNNIDNNGAGNTPPPAVPPK
jgi:hypothetical protein